jgi:hypothetical protein
MIINDLNFKCVIAPPIEADSPAVIDSDRISADSVSFHLFQSISRRDPQVIQIPCAIQHPQFSKGSPLQLIRQLSRPLPPKYLLGFLVFERPYHGMIWVRLFFVTDKNQ